MFWSAVLLPAEPLLPKRLETKRMSLAHRLVN